MMMTIADSMSGQYTGITSLSITGVPATKTPDEICVRLPSSREPQNSINILMKSLKLTTGPGNPCSGVGMEANGQTAIAEMRSPVEATNGLALDGLTVFNHVPLFALSHLGDACQSS